MAKKPVKYLGYTSPTKLVSKLPAKTKAKAKGGPVKSKGPKAKTTPVTSPPPLTPPDPLLTQAKADAQLQYGNQILREQGALHNAGDWFTQYKADARAAAATVPATYSAAATAGSQAPTVGPAVMTPEGQQAAASRGVMNENWKNYAGAQGAAQGAYFTGRAVVGSAQQLASRTSSQAKIAQLATDKDTYQTKRYGELQDAAHKSALEDAVFGTTAAKAASTIKTAAAGVKTARTNAKTNRLRLKADLKKSQATTNAAGEAVNAHGYTAKAWSALGTEKRRQIIKADAKGGGAGGFTPAEIRARAKAKHDAKVKTQNTWSDVLDTAAAIGRGNKQQVPRTKVDPKTGKDIPVVKDGKRVMRPLTRDEILDAVRGVKGRKEDHLIVALAIRHHDKEWDARTIAAARRLGLKVPKSHRPGKSGAVRPLQVPGGRY